MLIGMCTQGRANSVNTEGGGKEDFLEGVWQQRGQALPKAQNAIQSLPMWHSIVKWAWPAPLFLSPLQESAFRRSCLGTCVCLRQIGEAMALVHEHGAHSNWTDSSTFWPKDLQKPLPGWLWDPLTPFHTLGCMSMAIFQGIYPTEKKWKCIGVEAWCAGDDSFSIKPLSTSLPDTRNGKDGVFEGWCFKKNSFQAHTEIVFLTIKEHFQIFRWGGVF